MHKARPAGLSVMRADLDAATTTSVDAHEAQWRAGVNRQAQPQAGSHQLAASRAAAAKRKVNAMSGAEKEAAQRRNADRRNEVKRAKRAAAKAAEATEAAAAAEAEKLDAAEEELEDELQEELELRILERWGEAFLDDSSTRENVELQLRTEGYGAEQTDDGRRWYGLP